MPRIAVLSGLLALAACTATPTVVENSATAVTVRYDGIANKIDDATQVAQKVCASHDKIARLRKVNDEGIGQHFGTSTASRRPGSTNGAATRRGRG